MVILLLGFAWTSSGEELTDLFLETYLEPGSTFLIIPRERGNALLPSLREDIVSSDDNNAQAQDEMPPLEDFLTRFNPFQFKRGLYAEAKKDLESGKTIDDMEAKVKDLEKNLILPSDSPLLAELPKPKPPELEIPAWEGKVSIAGRKLISMNLQTKKYLHSAHPLRPRSPPRGSFDLKQELQLRVSGNVSDRVMVNIDYDDTKENKRDISIVYRGAPGETVKEIQFGDITLNLPQTQFTSYSKQLFGIKGEFDLRRARVSVVGSQTKGQFQIKRFSGQFQFESKDILDTSYIRRTYYNVAFSSAHLPIVQGSVVVYRDDRNASNNANAQTMTVDDFSVAASTYTGDFDTLVAGIDYIVDYQKGILRFLNQTPSNAVLAVDYTSAQGTKISSLTARPKIIKTDTDLPISAAAESGYQRELKTVYSIGRSKILRDDGTGNFILKVLEKGSRRDVSSQLGVGYPSQIQVDFEEGTFQLAQAIPDAEIYLNSPISKYIFALEYKFTLKTYLLQPSIVLQSEKVYKDGALLTRDVDYFIDYDTGFLTFMRPETITPQTQIEITYEVAPFGGRLAETLVGSRGEFDLLDNKQFWGFSSGKLSLGSSILLQQAAKPAAIPDIRSLPTSFSIYEGDLHWTGFVIPGPIPMKSNFHAELAQSVRDPNIFGKALVESMEGIKIEDTAILNPTFWPLASNPANFNRTHAQALSLSLERTLVLDINPNADATSNDTQDVLRLDYDLSKSTTASVAYVFSPLGLDFSNKDSLDIVIQGDSTVNAPDISFQLGKINEDSDNDGVLDTEDKNLDGSLNFGEDIGYTFNNPDNSSTIPGGANGKLDSEDLDKNGRLDPEDPTIGGTFGLVTGSSATAVNFNTWVTTNVALGINAGNLNRWTSIKVIRLTLNRKPGDKATGVIRIAKLGVTGMRWEKPVTSNMAGSFRVGPINSVDHPNYQPLFNAGGEVADTYNDLYGAKTQQQQLLARTSKRVEQALRLEMSQMASTGGQNAQASTRLGFARAIDVANHREMSFFLHGPLTTLPQGATFFMQVGSGNDYFEYQVPAANLANQWYLIKLNLEDLNRDGKPDNVTAVTHLELSPVIARQGNPNLASVSQLVTGVRVGTGAPAVTGEIWVDDIFLTDARDKKGLAQYLSADFEIPGWMNFGGSYKTYNRDFEGLGQAVVNQDVTQRGLFLSSSRLKFMPFSANASKSETVTPSALQTGPSNLISVLSEGRVEQIHGGINGSFLVPKLPGLNWSSSHDRTDNNLSGRLENIYSYAANTAGANFLGLSFMPSWGFGYDRRNYLLAFTPELRKTGSDNLKEFSDNFNSNLSFSFWSNRISLGPNYRLSQVKEERKSLALDDTQTSSNYPKSLNQSASLNGSLRLTSWLTPSFSFSSDVRENSRVESSSFTIPNESGFFGRGDLKSINRQTSFSVGQGIDFGNILPWRIFKTFSHSANFATADGDAYENVSKFVNAKSKLWVRDRLEVPNSGGRRTSLTMRDSVSVNSRWSPLLALRPSSAWSTLAIGHNFSRTFERSEITGTQRKSLSLNYPDLTVSLNQLEKLIFASRWMSSASVSTRYSLRKQTNIDIDEKLDQGMGGDLHFLAWQAYDFTLNYGNSQGLSRNLQTQIITGKSVSHNGSAQIGFNLGAWRFGSKIEASQSKAIDSLERLTQDQSALAPSITTRADFSLPAGLKLPFSSKTLTFTNRVILTSGLRFERKSSSLNIDQSNTDNWGWNLNGEFEVGQNVRAGIGSSFNLFQNRVLSDQDFYTFGINGQVIFQF